jgi:hypothetical protein
LPIFRLISFSLPFFAAAAVYRFAMPRSLIFAAFDAAWRTRCAYDERGAMTMQRYAYARLLQRARRSARVYDICDD